MKHLFTIIMWGALSAFAVAQESTCDERVNSLLINKVKPYSSIDLLPYYSAADNKWGYMHRKTKEKITEPILEYPLFFHPNISFNYAFEIDGKPNGCSGSIKGSEGDYAIEHLENQDYRDYKAWGGEGSRPNDGFMVNDNIQGFEVDSNGKLSAFNPKFYNGANRSTLIKRVFKFQKNHYAIAEFEDNRKTYYHIISQDGKAMPGFDKLVYFPQQRSQFEEDTDLWFFVKDDKGKFLLHSLVNNQQLPYRFDNGWFTNPIFGYAIMSENGATGIFDIYALSWKIRPKVANDFWTLHYASSNDVQNYGYSNAIVLEGSRKKVYIYVLTKNKVFYDLQMNKYVPNVK